MLPAELIKTLTDRKLAQQQKTTYDTQRLAEDTRKELEEARHSPPPRPGRGCRA